MLVFFEVKAAVVAVALATLVRFKTALVQVNDTRAFEAAFKFLANRRRLTINSLFFVSFKTRVRATHHLAYAACKSTGGFTREILA